MAGEKGPTDLVNAVTNSGLVDEGVLLKAFWAHALLAESEREASCVHFSEQRKMPAGIRVAGAGTEIVNGFYKEDGHHKGVPKYTKESAWKGEERTLAMYRNPSRGYRWWYIGIVGKDGVISVNVHQLFYRRSQLFYCESFKETYLLGDKPVPECRKC